MKWWTILFFGSLALNSMLAVFQKPFEIKDSGEYEWLSFNLRNSGLHYSGDPEAELDYRLYNKRPPLYSVFIGINQSPQSILLILLQTLLLCCLYFIGLSCLRAFCFPSELAKIYTFLMALNTPLLFSVGFTLADLFLALEISVLVYSILTFFRTGRHSYLYLASAFLSLSILTKPVMLPLGIFITPVLLWLFFTRKYKWMVLTPIITLLSLVAFNTYYLGFPHFSSISAINRLQYNAGLMDNDRPESASGFTMKIPGTQAEYKEFYVQWNRQSTLLI
jgi:hypothetical protein